MITELNIPNRGRLEVLANGSRVQLIGEALVTPENNHEPHFMIFQQASRNALSDISDARFSELLLEIVEYAEKKGLRIAIE